MVGARSRGLIAKYRGYLWLNSVEYFIASTVFSSFFIGDFGNFFSCYLCWKAVMAFSIIYVVNRFLESVVISVDFVFFIAIT